MASVERRAEGYLGVKVVAVNVVAALHMLAGRETIVVGVGALGIRVDMQRQLCRGEGFSFHATNFGVKIVTSRVLELDAIEVTSIIGSEDGN